MGCCGDPISAEGTTTNRPTYVHNTVTNQQPSPQPGLEKLLYQHPTIPSPPPVLSHLQTGTPQVPLWNMNTLSSSPPPAAQSTLGNSSLYTNGPLLRPSSAHHPTSPSMSMAHLSMNQRMSSPPLPRALSPPPDEGKMSISIDFGEYFLYVTCTKFYLVTIKVQHFLAS
jgi:hypothetical protein